MKNEQDTGLSRLLGSTRPNKDSNMRRITRMVKWCSAGYSITAFRPASIQLFDCIECLGGLCPGLRVYIGPGQDLWVSLFGRGLAKSPFPKFSWPCIVLCKGICLLHVSGKQSSHMRCFRYMHV